MNLEGSQNLKQLPDFSNATNLEKLQLSGCKSLVEIPSSFSHLQKLRDLWMRGCISLRVIPSYMNLASIEHVGMEGCPFGIIPFLSTRIKEVHMSEAAVEEVPASIRLCSSLTLQTLNISRCGNLKGLTHLPTTLRDLNLSYSDTERIPDCIKALHQLFILRLSGCKRLASLPELPCSLMTLVADDCESLENVFHPFNSRLTDLSFANGFKLDKQTRKTIIQRPSTIWSAFLPGRRVPEEFDYRARGNSLTISLHGNYHTVRLCVVLSSNHQTTEEDLTYLVYRYTINGDLDKLFSNELYIRGISKCRTDHLFIFDFVFDGTIDIYCREIQLEFSSKYHDFDIIECGAYILTYETREGISEFESSEHSEDDTETCDHTNEVICVEQDYQEGKRINCWSWISFGKKTTKRK